MKFITNHLTKKEQWLFLGILFLTIVIYGFYFQMMVLTNNNGKMPVLSEDSFETNRHKGFDTENKPSLWILSDIIGFENDRWRFRFSPGDILLIFGGIGFLYSMTMFTKLNKLERRTKWKN